jgi:hypothetical protein
MPAQQASPQPYGSISPEGCSSEGTRFTSLAEQFDEHAMQHPITNLESIRRDIAQRLRPSCANMSEEDFERMVARIALIEWKHLNDATPTSQMNSH